MDERMREAGRRKCRNRPTREHDCYRCGSDRTHLNFWVDFRRTLYASGKMSTSPAWPQGTFEFLGLWSEYSNTIARAYAAVSRSRFERRQFGRPGSSSDR
jgi:hypothetical protein